MHVSTAHPKTRTTRLAAAALTAATAATAVVAAAGPAAADDHLEEQSLAAVLDADGDKLDHNWNDFDIVHRAVTTVLEAKPDSAVGVVADGSTPLTAFVPNDRAFRRLVFQLTDDRLGKEKAVFDQVAGLGVDTVESVLLYHVVPGATITYAQAKEADGTALTTASSDLQIEVAINGGRVWLKDLDEDDRSPRVFQAARDINKGNKQIAHGITRVLRPADLP